MAAAAAVTGHLTDVRRLLPSSEERAGHAEQDELIAQLIAAMKPKPQVKPVARLGPPTSSLLSADTAVISDPSKVFM